MIIPSHNLPHLATETANRCWKMCFNVAQNSVVLIGGMRSSSVCAKLPTAETPYYNLILS